MDDFTWLSYPPTGGVNRFPADSVKAWKARGWVECDPPVWADPTRAHLADVEMAAPPVPVDPPAVPAPTPKTTRRPAGDNTSTEEAA